MKLYQSPLFTSCKTKYKTYFTEDVIRRRLLIDGDGTGDDRRLNVLLKTFIKWCNSVDEKPEDRLEFAILIVPT